jgi:hypothetical protein
MSKLLRRLAGNKKEPPANSYTWNAYYTEAELSANTKGKIDKAGDGLVEHYALIEVMSGNASKGHMRNMECWSKFVAQVGEFPSVKKKVNVHKEQLKAKKFLNNLIGSK